MFSNIYVINAFRHPSNMWNTMKDFLFLDESLSNVLNKKFYKILLGTCIGVINSVFYSILYKNNPDLRFFYYDEGIGIYCTPLIEASTKLKFFIRSIGGRDYFESISGLYAYMPKAILTNRQFPGYCIPAVSLERQELFNCIFAYSGEAEFYKDKTFVYGKPRNVSMNKLAYNLSAGGEYRLSPLVGISAKLKWIVTSSESYSVRYHGQKWQVESPELSGGGGCFSQLSLLFGMNLHF